jgi:hypothetical protein
MHPARRVVLCAAAPPGCVGGACVNGTCVCDAIHTGVKCDSLLCTPPCGPHASCEIDVDGAPLCACHSPYTGPPACDVLGTSTSSIAAASLVALAHGAMLAVPCWAAARVAMCRRPLRSRAEALLGVGSAGVPRRRAIEGALLDGGGGPAPAR